jgi:hypothetical protein
MALAVCATVVAGTRCSSCIADAAVSNPRVQMAPLCELLPPVAANMARSARRPMRASISRKALLGTTPLATTAI